MNLLNKINSSIISTYKKIYLKDVKPKMVNSDSTFMELKHLEDTQEYTNNEYALNKIFKHKLEDKTILPEKKIFHCYWYGKIERLQIASIYSVLATQNNSEVWLWIDSNTWDTEVINKFIVSVRNRIKVKMYNPRLEIKNTEFEKIKKAFVQKIDLPLRADAFRMLILSKYKGFYFDLDVLFLRDMTELMNDSFIYQWENKSFGNSAIFYLKNDFDMSILKEIIIKNKSPLPWVVFNFNIRNLQSFMVYPCAYFDPIWNITNINEYDYPIKTFEEFFTKAINFDNTFSFFEGCYAYHWHNQWKINVNQKSIFAYYEQKYIKLLEHNV